MNSNLNLNSPSCVIVWIRNRKREIERKTQNKTQTQTHSNPKPTPAQPANPFPFSWAQLLTSPARPNPRQTGSAQTSRSAQPARPLRKRPARVPASLSPRGPAPPRSLSPRPARVTPHPRFPSLTDGAHRSALSSPPSHASVRWPGRVSRRVRALGHPIRVCCPQSSLPAPPQPHLPEAGVVWHG